MVTLNTYTDSIWLCQFYKDFQQLLCKKEKEKKDSAILSSIKIRRVTSDLFFEMLTKEQ